MTEFAGHRIVCSRQELPIRGLVATLNPHSIVVAQRDAGFAAALRAATTIVADGVGLVTAIRLLGTTCARITGRDLLRHYLSQPHFRTARLYLLGSTPEKISRIAAKLNHEYPAITIDGYAPPFQKTFCDDELRNMRDRVVRFGPDILAVGLGAPKQERIAASLLGVVPNGLLLPIGAVFDFLANPRMEAPTMVRRAGLEWLYRLYHEPRRLWRRTFESLPRFLLLVIREFFA